MGGSQPMELLVHFVRRVLSPIGEVLGRMWARVLGPNAATIATARRIRLRTVFLLILFVPGALLLWSVLLSRIGEKAVQTGLLYGNERSMAVEVIDRGARYVGMLSDQADPLNDYIESGVMLTPNAKAQELIKENDIRPDHRAIHLLPDEVPPYFWKCLTHLEDRYAGSPREPAGIDIVSAPKMFLTHQGGGSTLPMMLVRQLRRQPPHRDESTQERYARKLIE